MGTLNQNSESFLECDKRYMELALRISTRALGTSWPNPAVGCVLVKESRILGLGWTAKGGRPHAETIALAQAGKDARNATAYITLEPCSHYGQTGPCADALIEAGIKRAVIAVSDPDKRVSGRGIDKLKSMGIEVQVGLFEDDALSINAGFFSAVNLKRPLITLKLASSLDGRIAAEGGDSRWITGSLARARGHLLRVEHDAILVGSGTVLSDNPSLTVRLPGLFDASPVRVILDNRLRVSKKHRVAEGSDGVATWFVSVENEYNSDKFSELSNNTNELIQLKEGNDGRPEKNDILAMLVSKGITRLLIEGGGSVAASFLESNLVDQIYWFRAPVLIGSNGIPSVGNMGLRSVSEALRFNLKKRISLGDETLEIYLNREDKN